MCPYKDKEVSLIKQREYNRKWYQKNKERLIEKSKRQGKELQRKKKLWLIAKLGGKCSKCGYNKNYSVLSIHHINEDRNGERLIDRSWKHLKKKLSSLQLLCANCHMGLHYPYNVLSKDLYI